MCDDRNTLVVSMCGCDVNIRVFVWDVSIYVCLEDVNTCVCYGDFNSRVLG